MALAYLATPYSKYPSGIHGAWEDAARLAARMLLAGHSVYSPIVHTHPIAILGYIDPYDHDIWLPFDKAMMDACESIYVAHMDGWDSSRGIAHEIEAFQEAGKPVYDLDPESLELTLRS